MVRKKTDFSLLLFIILVSILMALMMQSVVYLYISDTYNPNYYIYQILLYCLAGVVVVKNRRRIHAGRIVFLMWAFGAICFLFSFVQLEVFNSRIIGALFFNSFIIPLAFLNGSWLGDRLSNLKDRDIYLLLLQLPAFYSMYLLYSYNALGNWFDADAAFCVIVFFPFVFFFKREWLSIVLAVFYTAFALTSAKRSILILVVVCIVFFTIYLFKSKRPSPKLAINRLLLILAVAVGSLFILTNESSGLIHTQERIEMFGGITFDNGRYKIYGAVSSAFFNSSIPHFLFGHGDNAVKRDFNIGAHNDLLEIGYDFGVIAALLYITILAVLLSKSWNYSKHSIHSSAMRSGICITSIIILGMLNCIITSTVLEYIMFLAMGCAMGLKESQSLQNQLYSNVK